MVEGNEVKFGTQGYWNMCGVPLILQCSRSFRGHLVHLWFSGKYNSRNADSSALIWFFFQPRFLCVACVNPHKSDFLDFRNLKVVNTNENKFNLILLPTMKWNIWNISEIANHRAREWNYYSCRLVEHLCCSMSFCGYSVHLSQNAL